MYPAIIEGGGCLNSTFLTLNPGGRIYLKLLPNAIRIGGYFMGAADECKMQNNQQKAAYL